MPLLLESFVYENSVLLPSYNQNKIAQLIFATALYHMAVLVLFRNMIGSKKKQSIIEMCTT